MTTKVKQAAEKAVTAVIPPPDPISPATLKLSATNLESLDQGCRALDYIAERSGPMSIAWGEQIKVEEGKDAGRYMVTGGFPSIIPSNFNNNNGSRQVVTNSRTHTLPQLCELWEKGYYMVRIEIISKPAQPLLDQAGYVLAADFAKMSRRVEAAASFIDQVNLACMRNGINRILWWTSSSPSITDDFVKMFGFLDINNRFFELVNNNY